MNLERLEKELPNYFDSNLTPELIGPPGVGKSETIENMVNIMSKETGKPWGFATFFIATSTPVHAMGYMVPAHTEIGPEGNKRKVIRAEYTMPSWMFTREGHYLNDFENGILFLDEWDKGDADTKKALAPLILSNQVGPHRLHRGIKVVVASNRQEDRSGSTKNFDFIINRRGAIDIEPDFKAWERWAFKKGLPPVFILFPKKYGDLVFTAEVPREQGPFCTPRSYVAGINLLMARAARQEKRDGKPLQSWGLSDEFDAPVAQSLLGGVMGEAASTRLVQWLRMKDDTPDFLDIVADPDGTPVPTKADARTVVAYECGYHITAPTAQAVCRYMAHFPKDLQVTFATYAVRRDPMLIVDPSLDKLVKANGTLINAL